MSLFPKHRFDPDGEKEFADSFNGKTLTFVRYGLGLGMVFYALYYPLDKYLLPDVFWPTAIVRFVIVPGIAIPLLILSFREDFSRWQQHAIGISLLLVSLATLVFILASKTESAHHYLAAPILITAYYSIIMRLLFKYAAVYALLATVASSCAAFFVGMSLPESILYTLFYFTSYGIILFGTYWMEESFRNEFQIGKELINEKEVAVEATKLKDKFVSLVSHDLRAPISSVISSLQMIKTRERGLAPESARLMDNIIASSASLITLIDTLLDINRLQSGMIKLSKRHFAVWPSVQEMVERIAGSAETKGVKVENLLPADMRVVADPVLFGEVIHNLVSNAVKFTNRGGSVTICANPDRRNVITVRDTGIGIPPSFLPHIFKVEVKTTSTGTEGEKGTGLGLPYCHEIITLHGGTLTVESEPGRGTAFHISFKSYDSLILLVDDQEAHRKMMKGIISSEFDAEFLEADNGVIAIGHLKQTRPDLIITDINMPDMDGFDLIKTVREEPDKKTIPILSTTSGETSLTTEEEAKRKVMAMGASGFMLKPVIAAQFLAIVRKLLGRPQTA